MLRSMVRSTAGSPPPHRCRALPSAQPRLAVCSDADTEDEELEPAVALRKRFQSRGPDLKAELQDIVKENPDAAANVLRSWIGEQPDA